MSTKLARGARVETWMRSSWIVGLIALLPCACSSENASSPPPSPVDWHAFDVPHGPRAATTGPTAQERAAAEGYISDLAAPGFGALASRLTSYGHFIFPGVPDSRGPEKVLKSHEALLGAFDKRAIVTSRVWRTDSEQTVEWTMTGVQTKDWMGVPATNKPVVIKGVALLFTKDEGVLEDILMIFDVAAVKAQLGAGPRELAGNPAPAVPTGPTQALDQTHSPEEARDVPVARAPIDALEGTSDAAYLASFADDAQVDTLQRAAPLRGKEELKAYFKAIRKAIGQLDTTVDNAWPVGPFVVVEYSIAGEQLGPIAWIPAQHDRVLRMRVVDIAEIHDGKIAHVWRYDNPSEILAPQ
jgi:hypothetical protein